MFEIRVKKRRISVDSDSIFLILFLALLAGFLTFNVLNTPTGLGIYSFITSSNETNMSIPITENITIPEIEDITEEQQEDIIEEITEITIPLNETPTIEENITEITEEPPSYINYNQTNITTPENGTNFYADIPIRIETASLVQEQAILNEPVKWQKRINLNKETPNLTIELPINATTINVSKIEQDNTIGVSNLITGYAVVNDGIISKFIFWLNSVTGLSIYDFVNTEPVDIEEEIPEEEIETPQEVIEEPVTEEIPEETQEDIEEPVLEYIPSEEIYEVDEEEFLRQIPPDETRNKTIKILEPVKNLIVEYETPGPSSIEYNIASNKKRIIVYSILHYENIKVYSIIPDSSTVKLYRIINNTRILKSASYKNTNGNKLINKIEWIIPHLSNQTYEIEYTQGYGGSFDILANPTQNTPILNSTTGTNSTNEDITVYNQSTADGDGDSIKNIYNWFIRNESITLLNMPFEKTSYDGHDDDFEGIVINTNLWNETDASSKLTQNGKLIFSSSDASDRSAWLDTKTLFLTEDFDISYDYFIDAQGDPPTSCHYVSLRVFNESGTYTWLYKNYCSAPAGSYGLRMYPGSSAPSTFASDIDGRLRLKRVENRITGYMWNKTLSRWEWDGDPNGFTLNDTLGGPIYAQIHFKQEANAEWIIHVDNFKVGIKDYSNNSNFGFVGNATYNPTGGYDGFGAYEFDGVGNHINISDMGIDNINSLTISAWAKTEATDCSGAEVIFAEGGSLQNGIAILNGSCDILSFKGEGSGTANGVYINITHNVNGWNHYVGMGNDTGLYLFVNGEMVGNNTDNFIPINITNEIEIGHAPYFEGRYFEGAIDDFVIYNRSLTPEQIRAIYENNTNTIVSQETTVGETWKACITPNDGTDDGTQVCSNNLTILSNGLPTQNTPILNSTTGADTSSENLTVYNNSINDVDGDNLKPIYNWYLNNKSIALLNMPFENNGSNYGAKDYSGYGNDGTVIQAVWNRTGGYDGFGAYEFDNGNYIELADENDLKIDQENLTITAWVKTDNVDTTRQYIVAKKRYLSSTSYNDYLLTAYANAGVGRFNFQFGNGTAHSPLLISTIQNSLNLPGKWLFVGVTLNKTHAAIYINGTQDVSVDVEKYGGISGSDDFKLMIGNRPGSTKEYWNGTIDDVMIWNRSLSSEEISHLYYNGYQKIVSQETSVGEYWKAGLTLNDGTEESITKNSSELYIGNTAPTFIENLVNQTIEEGISYYYDVNGTDIDGDSLIYYINDTDLIMDSSNGNISWASPTGDVKNLRINISDSNNNATQVYILTISPDSTNPEVSITLNDTSLIFENNSIQIQVNATDSVGLNTINWNITYPDGTLMDSGNSNNIITLSPTNLTSLGTYNIEIYANDSRSNSDYTTTPFYVDHFVDCVNIAGAGTYYLNQSIMNAITGDCIDIDSDDIILDCQGNTLDGNDLADDGMDITGASGTHFNNITIKNCNITDWDTYGIWARYVDNLDLDNINTSSNPDTSIGFRDNINVTLNNSNLIQDGSGTVGVNIYTVQNITVQDTQAVNFTTNDIQFTGISEKCSTTLINVNGTDLKEIVYFNDDDLVIENWNNNFSKMIFCGSDNSLVRNVTWALRDDTGTNGLFIMHSDYFVVDNATFRGGYNSIEIQYSEYVTVNDTSVSGSTDNFRVFTSNHMNIINLTSTGGARGVYFLGNSEDNNLTNSTITGNGEYGMRIESQTNNYIFNNFWNNSVNYYSGSGNTNFYNTSLTSGTNIVGGAYIGGNYWGEPDGNGHSDTCNSTVYSGICDETLTLKVGITDYLPLSSKHFPIWDDTVTNQSTNEDILWEYDAGNATDTGGDVLTYSTNFSNATFSSSLGNFTWQPGANWYGGFAITINVTDGTTELSQVFNLSVLSVNDAPTFDQNLVNQTLYTRTAWFYDVNGTDVDGDDLTYNVNDTRITINNSGYINYTDPLKASFGLTVGITDGTDTISQVMNITVKDITNPLFSNAVNETGIKKYENITLNITITDDMAINNYALEWNDTGIATNISTFQITGTYETWNVNTSVNITTATKDQKVWWRYYACDTSNNCNVSNTYNFTVANTPPQLLHPLTNQSMAEDYSNWFLDINATDLDGDTLTYFVNDTNITLDSSTGNITFTPQTNWHGSFAINVNVTDGDGEITSAFNITVTPVNDYPNKPNITYLTNNTAKVYTNLTFGWNASEDPDNDSLEYEFMLADNLNFNNPFIDTNITTLNYTNTTQAANGTAYFKIRSTDTNYTSNWTEPVTIDIVQAHLNITLPKNYTIVYPAVTYSVEAIELNRTDWIQNLTVEVLNDDANLTHYMLNDSLIEYGYSYTVPTTLNPRILTVNVYGRNQSGDSEQINDTLQLRVTRLAGSLVAAPRVNSLCGSPSVTKANQQVNISVVTQLDTLLDNIVTTVTTPGGSTITLTANSTTYDNQNYYYIHNYSYPGTTAGQYNLTTTVTDTNAQAKIKRSSFEVADTQSINLSTYGFTRIKLKDWCDGDTLYTSSVPLEATIPVGKYDIEISTSKVFLTFLNATVNNSMSRIGNYTELNETITLPANVRAVDQFVMDSNVTNFTVANLTYDYTTVLQTITYQNNLNLYKCNQSACTWGILESLQRDVDNRQITGQFYNFSYFMLSENTVESTTTRTVTSSGTGGGTSTVYQPYSLQIIVPPLITTTVNDTLYIPVILNNPAGTDLKNIKLIAEPSSNKLTTRYTIDTIPMLKAYEDITTTMVVTTPAEKDRYTITTTATVASPEFTDEATIYLDTLFEDLDITDARRELEWAKSLFQANPDCLELSAVLVQSERALSDGDAKKSLYLTRSAVEGCKNLLVQKGKELRLPRAQVFLKDYITLALALLILFLTGDIIIRSMLPSRGKPKREHYKKHMSMQKRISMLSFSAYIFIIVLTLVIVYFYEKDFILALFYTLPPITIYISLGIVIGLIILGIYQYVSKTKKHKKTKHKMKRKRGKLW